MNYSTYQEARADLISKMGAVGMIGITGKARVQAGVIILWAEFGGEFIRITSRPSDMQDRAKEYTHTGRKHYFTINPSVLKGL